MSCHIILYRIIPYHIISYYIILYHIRGRLLRGLHQLGHERPVDEEEEVHVELVVDHDNAVRLSYSIV